MNCEKVQKDREKSMMLVLNGSGEGGGTIWKTCMTTMLMMTNASEITIDASTLRQLCCDCDFCCFFLSILLRIYILKMIDNCTGLTSIESKWCDTRQTQSTHVHTIAVIQKANKMVH